MEKRFEWIELDFVVCFGLLKQDQGFAQVFVRVFFGKIG